VSIARILLAGSLAMLPFVSASLQAAVVLIDGETLAETDFGDDHSTGQQDPVTSIHLALAAAQPGDIVEIRDTQPYILTNNHGLRMNTANVTLRGQEGLAARIVFQAYGTNAFIYMNAPGLRFENLILDNSALLYGNYAFQAADKLPDNTTYTCQGVTITGCTMLGVRGAINAGSGRIDELTFTHNFVLGGTRYGLGKSGLNFGQGEHRIAGNTFEGNGNGGIGAPDWATRPAEPVIDVESLHGPLRVEDNIFLDHDGQYAVFVRCENAFAPVEFSGNQFLSPVGNQGAERDLFPVPGGGWAVGYCGQETADAQLRVEAFELRAPWPNPFNPATTLSFSLPETAMVELEVLDLLGRRVSLLASGLHAAGSHRLVFDSAGLGSGLYFVRLHTPWGVRTQRATLLK
jgi:hypothetical protein